MELLTLCVMKIVHIQGKSSNVVIGIFHTVSKFFPLGKNPISKRDEIEVNHYLFQ